VTGLFGTGIAVLPVWVVVAGNIPIGEGWLAFAVVFPVMGIGLGVILAHHLSGGADAWPVTRAPLTGP